MNPEYAIGFVARVESAMAATLSPRRNSLGYAAEGKVGEAYAAAAISGRSRIPIAYSGLNYPRGTWSSERKKPVRIAAFTLGNIRSEQGIRSTGLAWPIGTCGSNRTWIRSIGNSAVERCSNALKRFESWHSPWQVRMASTTSRCTHSSFSICARCTWNSNRTAIGATSIAVNKLSTRTPEARNMGQK